MRRIDFKVPIYDWEVSVVTLYDKNDEEEFRKVLVEIEAEQSAMEETLGALRRNAKNGGDCWYDNSVRKSVINIFPWTSKNAFYNTINHEKRHLVDRILKHAGVNDIEASAYLDGYISEQIFSKIKELTT